MGIAGFWVDCDADDALDRQRLPARKNKQLGRESRYLLIPERFLSHSPATINSFQSVVKF